MTLVLRLKVQTSLQYYNPNHTESNLPYTASEKDFKLFQTKTCICMIHVQHKAMHLLKVLKFLTFLAPKQKTVQEKNLSNCAGKKNPNR